MADGKSLFHFSLSKGRSENQGMHVDPRKPIWLKDIPKPKQGSKGNQIFRKIIESMKTLIEEKNESPTPVVAELKRNQTSVRLIKSCHFGKIGKCTNLEWLEFWNSRMAHSNSISQPAGSQNQKNQATTTELSKDQKKESINLHSKVPSELTRDQIKSLILRNLQDVLEKNGMNFSRI